jgi:hypothetical protein
MKKVTQVAVIRSAVGWLMRSLVEKVMKRRATKR